MRLTIAYITSREKPRFDWLFDSLRLQKGIESVNQIIVVDLFADQEKRRKEVSAWANGLPVQHVMPKPNIWQGPHRITKDNWWAASNARNTAFALCRSEWIACMDDRCVLLPGWIETVQLAMRGNYIVAGAYEKRVNMKVCEGTIVSMGTGTDEMAKSGSTIGKDSREQYVKENKIPLPFSCGGEWLFGCNFALPIVCALQVNGFPEDYCDGVSMEDVLFGMILGNSKFTIKYDCRMKMIEDRTPGETGPPIHRRDKGVSPKDKTHKLLDVFRGAKSSKNSYNLSQLRIRMMKGGQFPMPTAAAVDWYDGQPIKEFVPQ